MKVLLSLVIFYLASEIVSEFPLLIDTSSNIPQYIASVINRDIKAPFRETNNILLLRLENGGKNNLFDGITSEVLLLCPDHPVVVLTNKKTIQENLVNSLAFVVITMDRFEHVSYIV